MNFSIKTTLNNASFDEVVNQVTKILADHKFGILTQIDVKATLKEKLNLEKKPYIILGACNPPRANRVLDVMPDVGLLLPCNVVVYENEDKTITAAALDPTPLFNMINNETVQEVGSEVTDIMKEVISTLERSFN
jgi:uncharacterized protein (DUF302 family)